MSENNPVYIFDTSAIIDMHKFYPINRVLPYWRNVEISINNGKFRMPFLVFEDISRKDDLVKDWFNQRKLKVIIPQSDSQNRYVKKIEADYPNLVNYRFARINADPFVIACGLEILDGNQVTFGSKQTPIIVAQEGERKKDTIPKVCRNLNLNCITIDQLWENEDWIVK
jgi:hypothetical protein